MASCPVESSVLAVSFQPNRTRPSPRSRRPAGPASLLLSRLLPAGLARAWRAAAYLPVLALLFGAGAAQAHRRVKNSPPGPGIPPPDPASPPPRTRKPPSNAGAELDALVATSPVGVAAVEARAGPPARSPARQAIAATDRPVRRRARSHPGPVRSTVHRAMKHAPGHRVPHPLQTGWATRCRRRTRRRPARSSGRPGLAEREKAL